MIPILYEKTETAFVSNGLGRLRDCVSCTVTEERNGIYECDFEYPLSGANFEQIQVGRIIGVTHDDTGDIEPFDIVSFTRPIDGVVTFHCTHLSYRLSYHTVTGTNINSLAAAFSLFENATPSMLFTFQTDKDSTGYLACADGIPRTVRSMMGGIEGSILDAYGGEYSFNNWTVYLHSARGRARDLTIRYGVNMLDYNEEYDSSGTYSSVIPYWTDGTDKVVGDRQDSTGATITARGECVPLDLSDKFETKPTKAQVNAEAVSYLNGHNTTVPSQSIKVEFVRLQDMGYENFGSLLSCELCDTIRVVFPDYNASGSYKIVKTVWDVLADRFESMELGELSTTLAEALGITNGLGGGGGSEQEAKAWAYCKSITSTSITTSGENGQKKIPITALNSGSGFTYDSTNKGIKCNKAGDYLLSCSLSANPATSPDLMGVAIYKNGASVIGPEYKRMGGNYDVVILPPSIITLAEGDYITIYGRNNSSGRGTFTGCRFSVWEI